MKNLILLLMLIGITVSSCSKFRIKPSAKITTETHDYTSFNKLSVSDNITVYLKFSDQNEGVKVEANENIHDRIRIVQESNELSVKLKSNTLIKGNAVINVYITISHLKEIVASDACEVNFMNRLRTGSLYLYAKDASNVYGDVEISAANIKVKDASNVDLTGESEDLFLNVSDASNFEGFGMSTENLVVNLKDASNASLTVSKSIRVTAKDASNLRYKGNPTIDFIDVSDASSVIKM